MPVGVPRGRRGERTDLHDVYDPKANAWTAGPPLPTARSGLASTLYKGLFMVLGGEYPGGTTNATVNVLNGGTQTAQVTRPAQSLT